MKYEVQKIQYSQYSQLGLSENVGYIKSLNGYNWEYNLGLSENVGYIPNEIGIPK